VNSFSSEKTKKDLLKMTKEFKNIDYFDVIYYTLGEIEEKEKNINQALTYYKKSAQTSQINQDQKAMAYLKLGEINFDLTNYQAAESYYDSTIAAISKDNINYETIFARKKTLETLVGYIKNISREDSLQKIARMSEADQNLFIDNMMLAIEKEAALKQKELEAAKENNNGSPTLGNTGSGTDFIAGGASFYFYNANTTALGVSDFTKKWGNRKWEDNWRRSNKALLIEAEEEEEGTIKNGGEKGKTAQITQSKKTRDYYKKDLPLTDSLFLKSTNKIIKSYYFMGSIYKEELNNTKKAIASFEELNKR
jgi:tetratricopeptide (TPR) repeat protein